MRTFLTIIPFVLFSLFCIGCSGNGRDGIASASTGGDATAGGGTTASGTSGGTTSGSTGNATSLVVETFQSAYTNGGANALGLAHTDNGNFQSASAGGNVLTLVTGSKGASAV